MVKIEVFIVEVIKQWLIVGLPVSGSTENMSVQVSR